MKNDQEKRILSKPITCQELRHYILSVNEDFITLYTKNPHQIVTFDISEGLIKIVGDHLENLTESITFTIGKEQFKLQESIIASVDPQTHYSILKQRLNTFSFEVTDKELDNIIIEENRKTVEDLKDLDRVLPFRWMAYCYGIKNGYIPGPGDTKSEHKKRASKVFMKLIQSMFLTDVSELISTLTT